MNKEQGTRNKDVTLSSLKYQSRLCFFLVLCSLLFVPAVHVYSSEIPADSLAAQKRGVFTGCSGGMMLHAGYLFAPDAGALFGNTAFNSMSNMPNGGVTFGIGGAAKVHFLDRIHLGGEGFVSTMPLMGNNSQIRTGWGGLVLDYYWTRDRFRPFLGFTLGGGSMRRMYEGEEEDGRSMVRLPMNRDNTSDRTSMSARDQVGASPESDLNYNAYFRKTPFLFVGPYVGFEYAITQRVALVCRLDYVVPFGRNLTDEYAYMAPSGPRLYVGFMFGHARK
ncbi:MAG: hypothetical protein ACI3Z8_05640 [Paludibacteraceae bacterium]